MTTTIVKPTPTVTKTKIDGRCVERARRFIEKNRESSMHEKHVATLEYLLANGNVGMTNRIRIDDVIQRAIGVKPTKRERQKFQQTVLADLKREGIVATLVYSGGRGGLFIPKNKAEIIIATRQIIDRVNQELTNIENLANITSAGPSITQLREMAELTKSVLEEQVNSDENVKN